MWLRAIWHATFFYCLEVAMSTTVTVNDTLLKAADSLYDAVDEVLLVLAQSPPHRLLALDGLAHKLRRAREGYDEALNAEPAEVDDVSRARV
jgi:hypothetical protein